MVLRVLIAILLLASPVAACEADIACRIDNRSYHVRLPDDWDGVTPMPVMLHFHGWGRQGDLVVNHGRISASTRKRGVLLLAPNGNGRTWNFRRGRSEDVDFAAAVIEDAAARFPIDRARIFVSGYSFGSGMAWRYVCENGNGVAALFAVSGTIDQRETCPEAPGEVRHVHGLSDNVMGYPKGQGNDLLYPVALWRAAYDCDGASAPDPYFIRSFLTFDRYTWDCPRGRVTFDQHAGGHFIPHGWFGRQLDEMLGLTPSYP
ncbi:polyhydroxybutyrate depolymerase [Cognatiyoonia koreensis]|uniref:Polyhydroxybutyrate depolymerase n=1 Tax=Cognatiyoonia koreensis TaxID=364200 RepID=A0A1I0RXJ4_9RHOB|nr:PHB depolymerase family esterase [Cognatiyoonia koreensis]SEW46165.1 polyhydroxybutyrate depolymerase [Cognatiyoonia koreensis]